MKLLRLRKFVLFHNGCMDGITRVKYTTRKPKRARPARCTSGNFLTWRRYDHVKGLGA